MIVTAGHFFANDLFMHGPQKSSLFAPDHMQRGSVSYLKPLRWLQDEHPVDTLTFTYLVSIELNRL